MKCFASLLLVVAISVFAHTANAGLKLVVDGSCNITYAAQRFCINGYYCDGCMNESFSGDHGIIPQFWNDNSPNCETPVGTVLSGMFAKVLGGDWVDFVSFLTSRTEWLQALNHCEQNWFDESHAVTGVDCEGYEQTYNGIYQIGTQFELGMLEDYIDDQIGPPNGSEYYGFNLDLEFNGFRETLIEMNCNYNPYHDWYHEGSPWQRVFGVALLDAFRTGEEFYYMVAAHSFVCYQSCLDGWNCGSAQLDLRPDDFWRWEFPYDYTQQPTFLTYIYYYCYDLIDDLSVPTQQTSWSSVKGMFHED